MICTFLIWTAPSSTPTVCGWRWTWNFSPGRGLAPTAEYEAVVARSIFPVAAAYTKEYYRLSDSPADIMA